MEGTGILRPGIGYVQAREAKKRRPRLNIGPSILGSLWQLGGASLGDDFQQMLLSTRHALYLELRLERNGADLDSRLVGACRSSQTLTLPSVCLSGSSASSKLSTNPG